jgi:biotin operon repressor
MDEKLMDLLDMALAERFQLAYAALRESEPRSEELARELLELSVSIQNSAEITQHTKDRIDNYLNIKTGPVPHTGGGPVFLRPFLPFRGNGRKGEPMQKEQLAEHLRQYHHGAENAVISRELECTFHVSGKELRDQVNALRREGVPIASDQNGYFYAKTEAEVRLTIRHMRNRISGISAAITGLRRSLAAFDDTQIRLPLEGGDDS